MANNCRFSRDAQTLKSRGFSNINETMSYARNGKTFETVTDAELMCIVILSVCGYNFENALILKERVNSFIFWKQTLP